MSGKRSIFEEVGGDKAPARPVPQPGLIDKARRGARGAVRIWLIVLFVMVAAMILVGGLTRLTDSGLSITEWKPVTGALPPMNAADWADAFEKYQAIPEYQMQNRGMSLSEFQFIYWWEWGHRQLGRAIGLVWAIGFFFFLLSKRIPTGWTGRLLGIGVLGGLQGAIGWWMVSSGLTGGRLDVASYRLATHLGLAFVILGFITWYVLTLGRAEKDLMQARRGREGKLFSMSTGVMHFAFLQILLGALVAGIDAGRNFTDWPLMAGGFLPPDLFSLSPWWRNFFEDAGLVQFMHRMAGYLLFIFGLVVWNRARKSGNIKTRRAFDAMALMLLGQVALGIVTVMNSSPLQIAIFHQLGAIVLWVLILRARFLSQYPIAQSIRGTA
ncbi:MULTISPECIES: heme A synthase [Actibacterium]|uniref:Heme A synthase n=1 Tax=Actibacterium naphthalenivorans TaxID=1614693 RepID=A0A840CBU4_9RHOB|nr:MULTISPECIES: heme A synthase [Actibacterium]ALG90383.1 heme A synthase [Actibacterium sp. EMB200-NS6]MBB4022313.1 cytochrome c oxidase assembly protein subunit 15 [Actibacterium naphthalenivorans]